ncbi:RNA 2',3'-cyclic phosphodiesterase [Actinomadura sp. DC4]|uniref:RNA 2',3'-cyclic phosphodiesterase n=1 Tax=Actinomadura sp. DC4 TaxID=3055069 RepID=UPI0025B18C10|nr:RNA 2',3'-cyclic phosphodiesterase [Actinomadura sp. DC4]MDN3359912.1 RNA 2',3'-cyclic phosphodiesterase [Actinomadura sp. DC4]
MRLFVALIPPEHVLDEVETAFAPYHREPGLRWTRRETLHVTLAFYGEVDDTTAGRLLPRLERAAGRHPRRELTLTGAGAFPKARSARTLWAGVRGDLRRLADSCLAAARREGLDTGGHLGFRPHLTVARSREPLDLRPLAEGLETWEGTPWSADEIHLVRSHLGAEVRYDTLRSWPLRTATASR